MIRAVLTDATGKEFTLSYDHDGQDSHDLLTNLVGWIGGVGVRPDVTDRLTHGSFDGSYTRTSRTISVEAICERSDRDELWHLERALSGLFDNGGHGTLEVLQDDLTLVSTVRLDGEVKVTTNLDAGYLSVQIPLFAADPHLYGKWRESLLRPVGSGVGLVYPIFEPAGVVSFGSAIDVTEPIWNDGNATAYPQFEVVANAPGGFAISMGGCRVTYPWPTFPDSPVVVDMAGSVLVSGVDQSHFLGERAWTGIESGTMEYPSFDLLRGGDGWATVRHRDVYI